ncbi:hypothetical protein MP638_003488 [Amoeboaphelidium occidentale]|nr:hypothetical protein MP638_003488 [Amoeboaphelidium occidentale]
MRTVSTIIALLLLASTCSAMKFFGKESINEPLLEDAHASSSRGPAQGSSMPPGIFSLGNDKYTIEYDHLFAKPECRYLYDSYIKSYKPNQKNTLTKVLVQIYYSPASAAKVAIKFCMTGELIISGDDSSHSLQKLFEAWNMTEFSPKLEAEWKNAVSEAPKVKYFIVSIGTRKVFHSDSNKAKVNYAISITPGLTGAVQWPLSVQKSLEPFLQDFCAYNLFDVSAYKSTATICSNSKHFLGGYYNLLLEMERNVPGIKLELAENYKAENFDDYMSYQNFAKFRISTDAV